MERLVDTTFWVSLFGFLGTLAVTARYLAGYYFKMQMRVISLETAAQRERREAQEKTVKRLEESSLNLQASNKALQDEIAKNTVEIKKLEALIASTVNTLAELSKRTDQVETDLKSNQQKTEELERALAELLEEKDFGEVILRDEKHGKKN